jgi:hypothetical protein
MNDVVTALIGLLFLAREQGSRQTVISPPCSARRTTAFLRPGGGMIVAAIALLREIFVRKKWTGPWYLFNIMPAESGSDGPQEETR